MFCDIVSDCFLTQLVSTSTRRDNILDIVLTNNILDIVLVMFFQLLSVIISLELIMMPLTLLLK